MRHAGRESSIFTDWNRSQHALGADIIDFLPICAPATMVCSECAGAHTHHDAQRRVWVAQLTSFWPIQRVSVHCSNHSPRGILIHPMEDLCLGFLLAPLLRPGSFCYSHCSSRHRLCLFRSALPLPLRAKNQRAIWKSPRVSTLLPIFPSSSSTAKSAVLS